MLRIFKAMAGKPFASSAPYFHSHDKCERQVWLGNVPRYFSHEAVRTEFIIQGFDEPAHIFVFNNDQDPKRYGTKDAYAIVTMHTREQADRFLQATSYMHDTFKWSTGGHAVARRAKGNVE